MFIIIYANSQFAEEENLSFREVLKNCKCESIIIKWYGTSLKWKILNQFYSNSKFYYRNHKSKCTTQF